MTSEGKVLVRLSVEVNSSRDPGVKESVSVEVREVVLREVKQAGCVAEGTEEAW